MERKLIHEESKSTREKGRKEWFDNKKYYLEENGETITLEEYESMTEITHKDGIKDHEYEKTETEISMEELPTIVRDKLSKILSPSKIS